MKKQRRHDRIFDWALALLVACSACSTNVIVQKRSGLPPNALATTFCDERGRVRSVIDAELFERTDSGYVAHPVVVEILVHEAVHRAQAAARPKDGPNGCPRPYTWLELLDAEIEAYCASFEVAVARGDRPEVIGRGYAQILSEFGPVLGGVAVEAQINARWHAKCPGRALVWN